MNNWGPFVVVVVVVVVLLLLPESQYRFPLPFFLVYDLKGHIN